METREEVVAFIKTITDIEEAEELRDLLDEMIWRLEYQEDFGDDFKLFNGFPNVILTIS